MNSVVPTLDPAAVPESYPASPGALTRRGLALVLPALAMGTGALGPAAVDSIKLAAREPGLTWYQDLHAALLTFNLLSILGVAAGLAVGVVLMVLTRRHDLALSSSLAGRHAWRWLGGRLRSPRAAAGLMTLCLGALLFLAAGYKVNHLFFTSFKNQHLAALLLASVTPLVAAGAALGALMLRIGLLQGFALVARIPVLRLLATLPGAVFLVLLALSGVAALLVARYLPIVRIIDWRPMSYPALTLGIGAALLLVVLRARHRRLMLGAAASRTRKVALALWAAVILGGWGYCLYGLGEQDLLRAAILRRAYGASRTFDLVSLALDFDGDGYLSFFGGGDCAPFNSRVHPAAMEIPGNGIDDNCFGGDLSPRQNGLSRRKFDHPLPAALRSKKLNLVLITMDGLRADHVGAYGYKRDTSPVLDAFARNAVLFERAYANAPSTRYSIPSFMTSKYSSQVPRENSLDIPRPIRPEALLMAEVLKKHGYRTGAALSYMVFRREWHMDQGFDYYDNSQADYYNAKGSPGWNPDQPYVLVDAARRFLDQNKPDQTRNRPFFLWAHFFEPHPPYVYRQKPKDFGSDEVGVYDGEIAFGDSKVGELLKILEQRPDAGQTVIAISADHGRALGEHGMSTHGYDLFGENLHVPLMVRLPGSPPRRIKNPVGLIDLLPTFVNLAGITEEFDFEGRSLVPQLVEGVEPDPERPIFGEVQVGFQNSHVINSITTRDYKLIYDVSYNTYQLYDLRQDPGEQTNVADKLPKELARLRGSLNKVMERATMPTYEEEISSSIVPTAPLTPGVTQVNFDNLIHFLGFTVHPERPGAGDVMTITWYVKGLAHIRKDYKFIVQLKGKQGFFFDAKHVPVRGIYPTSKWVPGQIIRDNQYMRLGPVPQEYEVWVGFGLGHDYLNPVDKAMKVENTAVKVGSFATF